MVNKNTIYYNILYSYSNNKYKVNYDVTSITVG